MAAMELRLDAGGEHGRHDRDARQDGEQHVGNSRSSTGNHQVLLLAHIGRIGNDDAHTQ